MPDLFDGISDIRDMIMSRNSSTVMIGIHVRKGDSSFSANLTTNTTIKLPSHFRCAESLEKKFLSSYDDTKRFIWYLLSDSPTVRVQAKKLYGSKLMTSFDNIEHTSNGLHECDSLKTRCAVSEQGFRRAAAEWWLFGHMDFFIIGENTGYGKSAAMRSLRAKSIFMVSDNNDCAPDKYTPVNEMAGQWSGL